MLTAEQVLDRYWDGVLPVRPENIAIAERIQLRPIAEPGYSGKYDFNGGHPFIEYNPNEPIVRKRFTVAHELGHHFHGDKAAPRIDGSDTFTAQHKDPIEVAANQFAAALLMPEKYVRSAVLRSGITDLGELANLFRVSTASMRYRLINLGML